MDSSHVATATITALLATALVYLSKWPLEALDLPTASAFAGEMPEKLVLCTTGSRYTFTA
jgi:hypothetical protein